MIATLTGTVSEKLADQVVIDVQGVGYGVFVALEDYGQLTVGEQAKLYVHEYVREQAHDLFGFVSRDTQTLFEQLLSVNGVGPRMALSVLSIGKAEGVRGAIADGNVQFIQQASGVGKKVAERIIVDLKDKVGLLGIGLDAAGLLQGSAAAGKDEAVAALMSLGYSAADASRALHDIDKDLPTGDRIKQALKAVGK